MAWTRGGEDDRRFRKALAASLAASLLLGALLPMIDLPLPKRFQASDVPKRLAQLVREEQAKPVPPPPVIDQARPDETPPKDQKAKPVQESKPVEQREEAPAALAASEPPGAPQKKVEKAGILAFRDKFASLAQDNVEPRLGKDARFSDADDASSDPTTRSMLTSNAPGSSGGINLAALSRNAGGGGNGGGGGAGGAGGMHGVQAGRVTSSIGGGGTGAGGDRPLASGGPGLSRTDEEIQIVFDRYKAALYRLYNRELRKDPTLRGQMVLRLTIEPDGSVSMCTLQSSDMNAPELSAQVVDRVRTINFGAKDVQALTIVYPIDFLPAA
jgi:outer membrane biosynthesis protein TonB